MFRYFQIYFSNISVIFINNLFCYSYLLFSNIYLIIFINNLFRSSASTRRFRFSNTTASGRESWQRGGSAAAEATNECELHSRLRQQRCLWPGTFGNETVGKSGCIYICARVCLCVSTLIRGGLFAVLRPVREWALPDAILKCQ